VATIRERAKADGSPVFHVQVRQHGFPARTASFPTRRQAERWAKTIEAEMIEGRHFRHVEARRRTLAEAIDRYLIEELPKKRSQQMHRASLAWWREKLGTLRLSEISPAIVTEYRGKLQKAPFARANPNAKRTSSRKGEDAKTFQRSGATVNRYLSCLSHLFTVARKEWHWLSHNPIDGVSKMRESRGRVRYLSNAERAQLLAETAKNPTLHTIVVLALSTAARAGELMKLTWRDVDLKEGRLLFRETKNAEPRTAWAQGEALRLLKEHAKVRRIDTDLVFAAPGGGRYGYHNPFVAAVDAAGISDFRFHDLRHSAATYLAMEGATEQQLRAIGGWKSGVVSRYVHLASTDAKDVLARMNKKILEGE
jgi:integrase